MASRRFREPFYPPSGRAQKALSSKPRKKRSEPKAEPVDARKEAPRRPSGKVPEATVQARHAAGFVTRRGKGFSYGELSGAGLPAGLASRWGLSIDARRRSVLRVNEDSLRHWGSHLGLESKPEGRVRRVEQEVEKVMKEVSEEAEEVKEEVVKVEKEVKKEAAKAGKAVRARARPKTKPKKKVEA